MKKFLCFILVICIFLLPNSGIINADAEEKNNKVIVNEYDYIKKLKSLNDTELKKYNVKEADIKKIKEFDMKKEIEKRRVLSDKELMFKGYSKEQIEILRNFDGSESQIYALSATLTLSAVPTSYSVGTNPTYVDIGFYWSWSQEPVFLATDGIGAAWNGGLVVNDSHTKTYFQVHYRDSLGAQWSVQHYLDSSSCKLAPGYGVGWEFDEGGTNTPYQWWADYGIGHIYAYINSSVSPVQVQVTHGHNQLGLSPGLDINGSPSVSFNWYVDETRCNFTR